MEVNPLPERLSSLKLTSNQRRRRAAAARLSTMAATAPLSPTSSSSRTNSVPVLHRSVPREEPPPGDVHALLLSSRPHGPPAAVSIKSMHTPAVASDVTSNKNSSPEPSSGSDEDDDEEGGTAAGYWSGGEAHEPGEFRDKFDLLGDLSRVRQEAARLSAEIAAVGSYSVRAGQAVLPAVKRDLGKDFLPGPSWSLTRLRDSWRADAVKFEARLRHMDPGGKLIGLARTEAEWRQCVVLVGVSEVKYLEWDPVTRAPHGASSAIQLAADAAAEAAAEAAAIANAAYLARIALIPPYVRAAGCNPEPLFWRSPANVRARAEAAKAEAAGRPKPRPGMSAEGARCVPHYDPVDPYVEDSDGGFDSEEEEEELDEWSSDPSQW